MLIYIIIALKLNLEQPIGEIIMAFRNDVFFSAELRNGDYHENDSLSGLAQDLINSYSEEPCLYNMELTRYKIADHSMKVITGKYWDIFCDVVEEAFENQVETPY